MNSFLASPRTVIALQGADRLTLLQRLCTQDLRGLEAWDWREAFLTDVKGKTLAHGMIIAMKEETWVVVSGDLREKLLKHFDRYIIREDVVTTDQSDRWHWLFVANGEIPNLGMTWEQPVVTSSLAEFAGDLWGFKSDNLAKDHTLIAVTQSKRKALEEVLGSVGKGVEEGSERDERTWSRIDAGWPEFGTDFDSDALPQEIDRDAIAISFNKGCYLGQETVARLDALGQVQKKLKRLRIHAAITIDPKTPVFVGDTEAGWVTSSAFDGGGDATLAFAFIKRLFLNRSTEFTVKGQRASFL